MCSLRTNLCGPNHVGDDWRRRRWLRRRCSDLHSECVVQQRSSRSRQCTHTSYPPSLIADTISGRLGMEGNVLRASSFTLPLKPFSSIRTTLLDQPTLSIFGRSTDDGRVTIPGADGADRKERTPSCLPPFCFMPPQDIPVLPRLPLLGAAFRLGGRYRRDPRFSWRRPESL